MVQVRIESSQLIYLDNNATTQPAEEVIEAVEKALRENWGNPSSVHDFGRSARHTVEEAREEVALLVGCSAREIVFTSGGTESCNLALRGSLGGRDNRTVIATARTEHSAVRECAQACADATHSELVWLPSAGGSVDVGACEQLLKSRADEIALVSVMWANNETGVIAPIAQLASLCRQYGVRFHTDATQWVGRMPTDLATVEVDLLTLSAHKFHGVKGAGALYCRRGTATRPVLVGGGQERGMRGGTEDVPGIAALGVAARLAREWLTHTSHEQSTLTQLRDHFEKLITAAFPAAHVVGCEMPRLWSTSNIAFAQLQAEAVVVALSSAGVCASAGAACSTGSLEPSPVLVAMGVSRELAHGAVRFSLSRNTTRHEIESAARIVLDVVGRLSQSMPKTTVRF